MNKRIIMENDGRYRLDALTRFGNWVIFGYFSTIEEADGYPISINDLE